MNVSSEFFVGMDVHKDSINFAVLTETSPSPVLQIRKTNTHKAVDETFEKLYAQGTVFACYEAGPCGYGLARYIESKGIQCQVFAPSKIPRKPGERRKTDRRDGVPRRPPFLWVRDPPWQLPVQPCSEECMERGNPGP